MKKIIAVIVMSSSVASLSHAGIQTQRLQVSEGTNFVSHIDVSGNVKQYKIKGKDGKLFKVDPATGNLNFITTPDFDKPQDKNHDNDYIVVVKIKYKSGNASRQRFIVTITEVVPANQAPIADAGSNILVKKGISFTLNASGSSDDKGITGYRWSEGSQILSTSSSFTSNSLSVGTHIITLQVQDASGLTDSDSVTVIISEPVVIIPPTGLPPVTETKHYIINSEPELGTLVGTALADTSQADRYHLFSDKSSFSIDSKGQLSVKSTLSSGIYTVNVILSNANVQTTTKTYIVVREKENVSDDWVKSLDYSRDYTVNNNMYGDLNGQLWFFQSQMHRPKSQPGEHRPKITAYRNAHLLFMMKQPDSVDALEVTVTNEDGDVFTSSLKQPQAITDADQSNKDNRPRVVFSKRSWTADIPWSFITPRMSVTISQVDNHGQKSAYLNAGDIEVDAPNEVIIQNIDLGMLVEPRGENENVYSKYNKVAEYAINYFETAPIAKYTVANYAPAYFPKVVLSNGTVYTNKSASTDSGVYTGDMRADIAKALVSIGIDWANIGRASVTSATDSLPRIIRHTVVHTARGRYTDPYNHRKSIVTTHGLSGGASKLTLIDVVGNEFSHEYGHDHGLGHYPGGIKAIHNNASGWSYNAWMKRFVANLKWKEKAASVTNPNTSQSVAPFRDTYRYTRDSLGGGNSNSSSFSKFTFYTPYSAYYIQKNLLQSGMIDDTSSTGYSEWNSSLDIYQEKQVDHPKPDSTSIPVMTLIGYYDPQDKLTSFIYPALYSNLGSYFSPETLNAKETNTTCQLQVNRSDGKLFAYNLKASRFSSSRMNQFQVNLPSMYDYTKAEIRCNNKLLDNRIIAAPVFDLNDPVIVGKEHGFSTALQQMRKFDQVFKNNTAASDSQFKEIYSEYYRPAKVYTSGEAVTADNVYTVGNKYYIALENNLQSPIDNEQGWYYLGDSSQYTAPSQLLILGEVSEDFTYRADNTEYTPFYFGVPVDNYYVSDSDAIGGDRWYGGGGPTKVTVIAVNAETGEKQNIIIRGALRNKNAIDAGAPVNTSSILRFYYDTADNTTLPKGKYHIEFFTYGKGWHDRDNLRVTLFIKGVVEQL